MHRREEGACAWQTGVSVRVGSGGTREEGIVEEVDGGARIAISHQMAKVALGVGGSQTDHRLERARLPRREKKDWEENQSTREGSSNVEGKCDKQSQKDGERTARRRRVGMHERGAMACTTHTVMGNVRARSVSDEETRARRSA